jgi:hypothetical protein
MSATLPETTYPLDRKQRQYEAAQAAGDGRSARGILSAAGAAALTTPGQMKVVTFGAFNSAS